MYYSLAGKKTPNLAEGTVRKVKKSEVETVVKNKRKVFKGTVVVREDKKGGPKGGPFKDAVEKPERKYGQGCVSSLKGGRQPHHANRRKEEERENLKREKLTNRAGAAAHEEISRATRTRFEGEG